MTPSIDRRVRFALAWLLLLVAGGATFAQVAPPKPAAGEAELLSRAQDRAQRERWQHLPQGLRLAGTTALGGVEAPFELFFARDGRFLYTLEGPLGRTLTFDGDDLGRRIRTGPSSRLVKQEREGWLLAQWVHSGYWCETKSPLSVRILERTKERIELELTLPETNHPARLELDPKTLLPRALHQTTAGGGMTLSFLDYEPVEGIPLARRVVTTGDAVPTAELHVTTVAPTRDERLDRFEILEQAAEDTRFHADRPSEVPMRRAPSGHLMVQPVVEGLDVGWFLLDSGAGQICIDPAVAEELGMESFGSVPAVGVGGSIQTGYRQGTKLELGPLELSDPVYVELDLSFLTPLFGVRVAGLCGYEIFARSVVELDLEDNVLALHDPLEYRLNGGKWQPLVVDNRIPGIHCRFEGDRSGLFHIDLGDAGTVTFHSPAVEALDLLAGRELSDSQLGGVGGRTEASTGQLAWFEIAGHRTAPLRVQFSHAREGAFADAGSLGNLGTEMLRPFRIVFDYPNERIALRARGS